MDVAHFNHEVTGTTSGLIGIGKIPTACSTAGNGSRSTREHFIGSSASDLLVDRTSIHTCCASGSKKRVGAISSGTTSEEDFTFLTTGNGASQVGLSNAFTSSAARHKTSSKGNQMSQTLTHGVLLTDTAQAKVKSLIEGEGRDDLRLRIEVESGGCSGMIYKLYFDDLIAENDAIRARLKADADAPASAFGLALLVASVVNDDGSLGARNALSVGKIEEKMGIHGNATCVMNYDGATGYMVGEENKGLAAMFIMMNIARLGVGQQGLGVAEVAYQNAVQYAHDRRQGRALTGPQDTSEKADTLFVHPDVRRMLMDSKAFTEGMRALCLNGALLADLIHSGQTEEERVAADDLLSLLTPVIKGYGTDKGYEVATNAQQVYGGHGYVGEWGMEQYVRDARITMIYEGANGVQAMDLVGRKLAQNGGRAVQAFFKLVDDECAAAKGSKLEDFATRLEKANGELKAATMWFMANGMTNPNQVGAGAHHYMHIMGIVSLGLMWLRMGAVAVDALANGASDKAFYEAKLTTARYYGERFTPDAGALRRKIEAGSEAMMALPIEAFTTA